MREKVVFINRVERVDLPGELLIGVGTSHSVIGS